MSGRDRTILKPPRWRRSYNHKGWLFILPALLLLLVMEAYPVGRSLYMSFFDYSILEPDSTRFVGVDNYAALVTNDQNRAAFRNTLYFTVLFVPPYVLLALAIALGLHRVRRGAVLLRTLIFIPIVVSLAVSAVLFTLFYNASFGLAHKMLEGLCAAINALPRLVGGGDWLTAPTAGVLGDPAWAMPAIALMCLWNGIGLNVILYLVGLQRIPDELHEAAVVDGASAWQRFVHVTLPQLRPTTYLVVLLSLIGAFKVFGQPYIMTLGGPQDATMTYVMRLYNLAFRYGRFELGYASAMAYALAVFIFVMALFVKRLNKPVD